MKIRARIAIREYAKAAIGMLAGALLLAFFEFCWLAKHDFFLVRKDVAQERRAMEEAYDRLAITPIDEFEGEGP